MHHRVSELLEKYKNETITPAEWEELRTAVLSADNRAFFEDDILALLQRGAPSVEWDRGTSDEILQSILSDQKGRVPRRFVLTGRWLRYAAAIIAMLGLGGYWWYSGHRPGPTPAGIAVRQVNDIHGGNNGAMLTLSDGSTIKLETGKNGLIASQQGAAVLMKDGRLVYDASGKSDASVMNMISTVKGRQFNVVLPDGTNVYLNAASSLRYPTVFRGGQRRVEVRGEAYFEVTARPEEPFVVSVDERTEVQVLGTSFNVNAYENEEGVRATLVKGSIRLVSNGDNAVLVPGEQGRVSEHIQVIKNADLDKVLAWKNGIFNFEGVRLREMMRQLERWYDIEVVYGPDVPDPRFFGKISRKVSLGTVLEALKGFGLRYEMKGERKLMVLK